MVNPSTSSSCSRRLNLGGFEENVMAMFDASEAKDSQDSRDDSTCLTCIFISVSFYRKHKQFFLDLGYLIFGFIEIEVLNVANLIV